MRTTNIQENFIPESEFVNVYRAQESIPPASVACRAGTSNRVVGPVPQAGNRFLGSLKGLQIRAPHCKKELAVFPSPAGMSLIKLFLGGNNLVFSRPERVWSVTSRLGTGKWLTLFYSACTALFMSGILYSIMCLLLVVLGYSKTNPNP
jgi:hypothetical protein